MARYAAFLRMSDLSFVVLSLNVPSVWDWIIGSDIPCVLKNNG